MSGLKDYISQIAVFLVLMSVVNMIMPKTSSARVARLVLAAVLLTVMLTPIGKFLSVMRGDPSSVFGFGREALLFDGAVMAKEARLYEDEQKAAVLLSYRESLNSQLEALIKAHGEYNLVSAYFSVSEGDEDFGMISFIKINVASKDAAKREPLIKIEKPAIKVDIFGNKGADANDAETDSFSSLKKLVSSFYGVDEGNIFVETGDERPDTGKR